MDHERPRIDSRPRLRAIVVASLAVLWALAIVDVTREEEDVVLRFVGPALVAAAVLFLTRDVFRQGRLLGDEQRARRRADALGRATELLGVAQDPQAMAARVADIAVPVFADHATVDLDGHRATAGLPPATPSPAGRLELPLAVRDRTLGTLTVVRADAPFDAEDAAVGRALADRAAVALESARLFEELRESEERLDLILGNLGEAVTARTPEGRMIFANAPAAALAGFATAEELVAADVPNIIGRFRLLDANGEPLAEPPLLAGLRGERHDPAMVQALDPESGEARWLVQRIVPVLDEADRVRFVLTITEDVTAVKREEQRQRLLAMSSKLLGSSLDVSSTVEKAAWAVVPELADWARVDLPDERGELREAAVAHRDLQKVEVLREWRRRYPPDPRDTRGPAEVLRTGRSVAWWTVDAADYERYAQDDEHAALMRAIDTRSILNVPLVVGDRVTGVLQLATTGDSGRLLGPQDLELAEELARRAAIALEHALLHTTRTEIATTLQRSLLPPRLPVVPGLTIAARFRAAGLVEVGGDFYDLFEARDGWMVVIGDVTGKGAGAAAITSLARYTLRTAASYEDDPRAVVQRLNTALSGDPERRQICTAVCVGVRETPHGPVLRVVRAGHPPPLLIDAHGNVRGLGRPGTLLGAFTEGRWHAEEVRLAPGESVVLYTDGVTDTRGEQERFGQDRLEEVLRGAGGLEADAVAGLVDDAVQAFGEQRDDVALLVLRADPGGEGEATVVGEAA